MSRAEGDRDEGSEGRTTSTRHGDGSALNGPAGSRGASAHTTYTCDLCGNVMLDLHCKLVCEQCGYKRDCSDP